tara:strand:- start:1285 stop:1614 length:330 start_codon:yes stop_codon:yes gene_type:complete
MFEEEFKNGSCFSFFEFKRLVGVSDRAEKDKSFGFVLEFLFKEFYCVYFDVDKVPPCFEVSCVAFHEVCIAVDAGVLAASVGVYGIGYTGESAWIKDAFCLEVLNLHRI